MKFEITMTVEVNPDAAFFDSTGFKSLGLQEYLEDVMYDEDDIEVEEIEVKSID